MIVELKNLHRQKLTQLSVSAKNEGFNHINRLFDEYEMGKNRFNRRGEILIGYEIDKQLVAVCGLNIEPANQEYGRIRRLYVIPNFRKKEIGQAR